MKSKVLLHTRCTIMKTTSWLLVIICSILVHNTDLTNSAPTEINSPPGNNNNNNDHFTGIYPTATIAPQTSMTMTTGTTRTTTTMPMTSAKSWSSQKPSRSKHITKSNLYKKPSKDRGGWAKVPFLSPTLVPTGYDVEKDISRHKEAEAPLTTTTSTFSTTIDTVVDNVNGPKDYTNKNSTNTSTLRHFDDVDTLSLTHSTSLLKDTDVLSTNANGDEKDSGKDIDFISDSRTTKADETYATTEGYHAKVPAAVEAASSTTTMPTSRVENPVSNMEATISIEPVREEVMAKSIVSSTTVTYTPTSTLESKSMPVNALVSFSSPSTTIVSQPPPLPSLPPKIPSDVGHDGVKVTKKKQLFDKHFIAASKSTSPLGSLHSSSMRKDNPWTSLSKNKPTKSNFAGNGNGNGGGKKLMEVPNGYLGPIMMKEKTFSVSHFGKKPKPKSPSLVEQKLKDKKLVEIIAPTALMEPISKAGKKNSHSQPPDFVAIDNMMMAMAMATTTMKPTTTTTTDGVSSTSTEIPIIGKGKKKEIESETATTYFLVVTQDGQAASKEIAGETARPPVYPEMEPLNSGEIESTLREIYAEVINAMEGGSRGKTTSTEVPVSSSTASRISETGNIDPSNHNKLHPFDSDHEQFLENDHQTDDVKDSEKSSKENQMVKFMFPSTESSFNMEGTPLTLNIFHPSSLKQSTSATIAPPIDETPIPVEQFTSSATNIDQTTTKDPVTFTLTRNSSTDLKKIQENLQVIDQMILRRSGKISTTTTDSSKIDTSTSVPPLSSTSTIEPESKVNTPSERPSLMVTKIPIVDTTPVKELSISEKILTEKKSADTIPTTFSPLKEVKQPSSIILSDDLIVSDPSLVKDLGSSTTQSSISSTKILQTQKSLLPTLPEVTTNKNHDEDYSTTTTEGTVTHLIVENTVTDQKIHLVTDISEPASSKNDLSRVIHTEPIPSSTVKTTNLASNSLTTTDISADSHVTGRTDISSKYGNSESHTEIFTDTTTPRNLVVLTTNVHLLSSSTTDFPPTVQHDSSTSSPSPTITNPSSSANPTKIPVPTQNNEPAESKISDIQIEVYDSTLEPIVAATNFKHSTDISNPSSHTTSKHSSNKEHTQERFTQYVVDKSSDFATQESSSIARTPGKPEPAAIEIHINVSEGFGNESEDLEFLYRQSDFRKFPSKKPPNSLKPFDAAPQNETSNEAAEEIVVEIIDGNSNSTENSASRENLNVNPVFTFRSDDDSQVELKNVKYYPEDRPKDVPKSSTDDFFVPHVGQHPSSPNKPLMDRDSDTIFYISNTEVKVGESLPTANTYDTQMKKSRLESQFFPANYEEHKKTAVAAAPQRYEEDIILSPPKNGPLKVIRRPLDISYVGESIMEVEQVTLTTTQIPQQQPSVGPGTGSTPDVIIEPAVLPEMAIGVPVIGELPPQIELKEIDYMPNFDGNKEESSIQYGGDLIDEGGAMGVGFDMDSYPLGNLGMGNRNGDGVAISSQMLFNHRVNHLKKDVLSADIGGGSSETTADGNDLLLRQGNDSAVNGTGEKMGNATAYSVMEDRTPFSDVMYFLTLRTLVFMGLYTMIPLILAIFLIFIWRDYNRKYKRNPFNAMGRNSSTDPLDAEKGNGGDGDGDGLETPEELRASSLAFGGATTQTPSLEICTDSNEATNGNASDGDGRNCNGSNSNSRSASDTMDLGEIKAYNSGDFQEENSTLTVHCCNIESSRQQQQQMVSSNIPPQSTTTTNAACSTGATTSTNTIANVVVVSAAANGSSPGTMHSNYSGANGSITTMTLKNNHLIVETEERNDISRDTRVTKMHYNNSEKDGVFVVEVSRGADSKIMPGSPVEPEKRPFNIDADVKIVQSDTEALLSNHEKVQVHPPPPSATAENLINHDDIDTNHLHQIDEVDEFEECQRFAKNSNTGLSQSDLSSSSSVDSNKRYSYGNQELYTIEQQDYTTPSPIATKAPHPHAESKHPQPENHNDDNGHPENGHCHEKSPPPAPKCNSSSIQTAPSASSSDKVHDMNGHGQGTGTTTGTVVESKPKITAALLKQDTVVVNEVTNGSIHDNGNENEDEKEDEKEVDDEKANDEKATPQIPTTTIVIEKSSEPTAAEIKTFPADDYNSSANTENGFDSIISLPDPPSTEEIKQMNDIILMETNQLDSLPPPPPPAATTTIDTDNHHQQHQHHNGNGNVPFSGIDQNGDSHSIVSSESPIQTPTKVMKPLVPPTITVADTSALTTNSDIPVHTNGNCMTGHATTAIAVEVSGSS
ncbi:mucin-2 [Episyrphus balteatus]|uniref:mucin-2 n=1 Tax=Episyrphus balteatus TaxID=286459 RepID=UPI0024860312|nr:mucin-2 [Episyrphus balteatus]